MPRHIGFEIDSSVEVIFAIASVLTAIIVIINKAAIVQSSTLAIQMTALFFAPADQICAIEVKAVTFDFAFKPFGKVSYFFVCTRNLFQFRIDVHDLAPL